MRSCNRSPRCEETILKRVKNGKDSSMAVSRAQILWSAMRSSNLGPRGVKQVLRSTELTAHASILVLSAWPSRDRAHKCQEGAPRPSTGVVGQNFTVKAALPKCK